MNVCNAVSGQGTPHCWRLLRHVTTHAVPRFARALLAPAYAFSLPRQGKHLGSQRQCCASYGRPDLRHGSVAGAGTNLGQRVSAHSLQYRGEHHLEHRGAGRFSGRNMGAAALYGAFSALSTAKVTAIRSQLTGLAGGTTYHFRVRSSDANGVVVVGPDYVLVQPAAIAITVNPPSLNFGTTAVNSCSAVQVTTVTNNGKSPVTVGPFVLTGTSVGDFVWGGVGTCSSGQALAPGMSCTHSFKFCPTAAGDRTGADSITNSTSSSPTVVTLSGTGSVSAPALAVSPASLSFAGQTGSSSITPSSVSITNTGTGIAYVHGRERPAVAGALSQLRNRAVHAPGQRRNHQPQSRNLQRTCHADGRRGYENGDRRSHVDVTSSPAFGGAVVEGQLQPQGRQL